MPKPRVVKATIAYHGAKFSGWQIQRQGERTVQAVFEDALKKATGEKPKLIVASRTDAGVHALGQVVQFELPAAQFPKKPLAAERLRDKLNHYLPEDVAVRRIQFMRPSFNARYGPRAKQYRFQIYAGRVRPVVDLDTCVWVRPGLDEKPMREAARFFLGRHDFTSFSALTDDCEDRRRTITRFSIRRSGDRITCDIVGDSFLQHMIRIMMGTLIDIGKGDRPVSDIPKLLASKNRLQAGRTAAPHGLTLLKVYY